MLHIKSAFTLLELICVCAVIGLLLATSAPAIGLQILQARISAETSTLRNLAAAAQASFESTDLEGTNIAALPGTIPAGVDATAFSATTDVTFVPATTNAFDWFAKLTRQLGSAPQAGVPPTPAQQPQAASVLVNPSHNTRLMLVGPATEANQQRFLIVSLIAAPGQLALPPLPDPSNLQDPSDLALFNDIWNTDWTNPAAVLPPTWTAGLSAAQIQAWQGGTTHRLRQLCVQRIVCAKFTITINDTHPSDNGYVYFNFNGATSGSSVTAAANSGASVVTGILAGRLIQAYRGSSPPPSAQLFSQFILRDNCEITLQD